MWCLSCSHNSFFVFAYTIFQLEFQDASASVSAMIFFSPFQISFYLVNFHSNIYYYCILCALPDMNAVFVSWFVMKTIMYYICLNVRFLWLKNKAEINLFENLHSFKVVEASDLNLLVQFLVRQFVYLFWSLCL
jgi:hypothetical protein